MLPVLLLCVDDSSGFSGAVHLAIRHHRENKYPTLKFVASESELCVTIAMSTRTIEGEVIK